MTRAANPPNPEILYTNGYDGFQGTNYVGFVEATVRNQGGDGWIRVYAEISGAGKYEKRDQRVYLRTGERATVTFVFDLSFWGALFSSTNYKVWAVAD
ncbi:MAG: hypothetical protein ACFFCW_46825 [Candidatus Hodarchaeota archaeon]